MEQTWKQLNEARVHLARAQEAVRRFDVVGLASQEREDPYQRRNWVARCFLELERTVNQAMGELKMACVQLAELGPPPVLEDPDVDPGDDVVP